MTSSRVLSWWQKPFFAFGSSRPGGWFFLNIAPILDRWLLRVSGGRWSTSLGQPVGLLRIRGAKSGQIRETILLCTPFGENYIVVASRTGDTKHPAWYYNLRANPDVHVLVEGKEGTYIAHETTGQEREMLWQRAIWFYPGYAIYEKRAGKRIIPVFLLRPKSGEMW